MPSTVTLHDISSQYLRAPVAYAVLAPTREEPLPLFILLLGAGYPLIGLLASIARLRFTGKPILNPFRDRAQSIFSERSTVS